jgi:hypothetical protein
LVEKKGLLPFPQANLTPVKDVSAFEIIPARETSPLQPRFNHGRDVSQKKENRNPEVKFGSPGSPLQPRKRRHSKEREEIPGSEVLYRAAKFWPVTSLFGALLYGDGDVMRHDGASQSDGDFQVEWIDLCIVAFTSTSRVV